MQLKLLPTPLLPLVALAVTAQSAIPQPSAQVLSWKGQDPCDLKIKLAEPCTGQTSRRDDNDDNANPPRVTPNPCTCTNVFFNLWSACLLYTPTGLANSTLPVCGESLVDVCAQASLNITVQPAPDQLSTYPAWAYSALPASNATFDIEAAVQSASASQQQKWMLIQIVLPIIVGLSVGIVLIVAFYFYRRRKNSRQRRPGMSDENRGHFHFPSFSSTVKVREMDRSSSWSIDEPQEGLTEYEFVSYPASLQGSHASGHVRLSSSSSGTTPAGLPTLKIPRAPVWAWPGKSMLKGSIQQLRGSIPRPWRSTKRVAVKSIPGHRRFRVDGSDSDSPLSQRPHDSLLGHHATLSRTNLQEETVFENDDESDGEAEMLPLVPEQHSQSNHDAEPPREIVRPSPDVPQVDSLSKASAASKAPARQIPPLTAPPTAPLPLPPPLQPRQLMDSPVWTPRTPRSHPALPPAPTSPPPPLPTVARRSPRAPRAPLPTANLPSSPPLDLSQQLSPGRHLPPPPTIGAPPPRRRGSSDDGSSVRSLPLTPTPSYIPASGSAAPSQVLQDADSAGSPPNSAPPYIQRPSQDFMHSPLIPGPGMATPLQNQRSVRRLPLPPS